MPAVSKAQERLMQAAAHTKGGYGGVPQKVGKEFVTSDGKIKGAGIMLITPQDEVLFLLRSPSSNHPNEWDFPGGKADDDETPEETAKRETEEEIGSRPYGELKKIADTSSKDDSGSDVDFITFKQYIRHKFTPKLDPAEHTAYKWASLENPPEPLHPGVREVVDMALGREIAEDGWAFACDAEHWITTGSGTHLLIEGDGQGGYSIKGGAGGKLNGKKVSPKSMSENRINEKSSSFNDPDFKPHESNKTESASFKTPSGHETLQQPLRIKRETEKAYGIETPGWSDAKSTAHYDVKELSREQREMLKNGSSMTWIPKSHSMMHEGHIVTMSPWLAKKQGLSTHEGEAASEQRFEAGKQRYSDLIAQAKAAGVPGVRERMKTSTIKEKMRAHGMSIDESPYDDFEFPEIAKDCMPCFDGMAFDRSSVSIVSAEMALDFQSVRTIDVDGRMHISEANLTMEQVAPYYGNEIPDFEQLGLDAGTVYQVYRPAEELEKAVNTFNLIPLMSQHVPINSKKPEKELVCGSTGSSAKWEAPYIKNSLVITVAEDVKGIEDNKKRELSAGYYYKPVMENGVFKGQPYQIRMTEIVANHLALVEKGRAGPQVTVGDSSIVDVSINLNGVSNMSDIALSKRATKAKGALLAVLKPIMATDAQANISVTLDGILADVKRKNWLDKKPGIIAAIKPLLAKDTDLKDVVALIDKLDSAKPDDDNIGQDDADPKCEAIMGKLRGKLRGKISDEDMAEIEEMMKTKPVGATDEPPQTANAANANPKDQTNKKPVEGAEDDEDDSMNQEDMTAAMDAAIKKASKETELKTIARMNGIAEAREMVKPIVGHIAIACDSAEDVYKAALKLKGIETADVHPSAFKSMVSMLPKAGEHKAVIAHDSASSLPTDILEIFPQSNRVSH